MTSKSILVKKYTMFIVVFLMVIVLALIFARGGGGETIKIGVIVPLSGEAQQFGVEMKYLFDYQVDVINDQAKDKNVKFELVYEDGQCDTQSATDAYTKLTEDENVQFILGGACSSETLAIAPMAEQDNTLVVSATSSSSKIAEYDEYVFTLSYPNTALARALAQDLEGYGKIALFSEDIAYTTDILELLNKELQERGVGGNVVFDRTFAADTSEEEFGERLQELIDADPDVIFLNPNIGETAKNSVTTNTNKRRVERHSAVWSSWLYQSRSYTNSS